MGHRKFRQAGHPDHLNTPDDPTIIGASNHMQISKFTLAVLLIGTGSAHAQFGMSQIMNPMTMIAPMGMMASA